MPNIKFKTTNLKSARFILKGASANGFRKRFAKLRDFINSEAAPFEVFNMKDGTTLGRNLTVEEMRKRFPEDELPVCNVSVRQNGNDAIIEFTAPAKAVKHFGRGDIFADIPALWHSQELGWAHDDRLEPLADMTPEVADKNGVVAAMCCQHCYHYAGTTPCAGDCAKLKCRTYSTDVCKHYSHDNPG